MLRTLISAPPHKTPIPHYVLGLRNAVFPLLSDDTVIIYIFSDASFILFCFMFSISFIVLAFFPNPDLLHLLHMTELSEITACFNCDSDPAQVLLRVSGMPSLAVVTQSDAVTRPSNCISEVFTQFEP